jgi:uncharacterized protein YecE (DUF72 family)
MGMAEAAIEIGTSGWSYPSGYGKWNGIVYPRRWKGDELAYYAARFPAVEVNTSFYRLPAAETVRGWITRTPAGFHFAVKLFQKFTHPGLYARTANTSPEITDDDVAAMRGTLDLLAEADRLRAVLAQYPESFTYTPDHVSALVRTLDRFKGYPLAVELRHPSWQREDTRDLLAFFDAAFVRIDEPYFNNLDEAYAPAGTLQYWRFHGRNREQWRRAGSAERRYDYLYDDDEINAFVDSITRNLSSKRTNLLFFNNHVAGKAVVNALMLAAGLKAPLDFTQFAPMTDTYPALSPLTGGGAMRLF